ncbi:hypothetical protein ACR34G_00210 [Mycoplasma sp. 480]|uniref:hypothetical protein n=1 Tax=Mycoplasma sp. 480 TaxID=3440155 RepID=UPI003F513DA6
MKKKLMKFLGLTVFASPVAAFVACGATNEFADSKEIIVAKEGKQDQFWKAVEDEFNKTEWAKKGYKIKFVEKDVFGAIDTITNIGNTDKNAPDLIYAPNDRITDLLSKRTLASWKPELKDAILNEVNATDDEKAFVNDFGTFKGRSKKDNGKFYNFAHNKEGIVVMSSKTLDEVKTELANTSTDEMVELVKEGKAFFRIQDGWYGNGVLASILSTEEMGKIIYKDTTANKWSSGFMKGDQYNSDFSKALDVVGELLFPVYEAAFVKTADEFKTTKWATKGIDQGALKDLLKNDQGVVQNKIVELLSHKKLDYAFVGSWDFGTVSKQGITTFFNAPKLKGELKYTQAPGTWSWAINSRNNGAVADRQAAIEEVLKLIFKTDSYYGYFKGDTKIPYFTESQKALRVLSDRDAAAGNQKLKDLVTKTHYTSEEKLLKAYNDLLSEVNKNLAKVYGTEKSWSQETDKTNPLGDKNKYKEEYVKDKTKYPFVSDGLIGKLGELKEATGLRNALSALLGIQNVDLLKGGGQPWQIAPTLVKDGVEFDKSWLEGQTGNAHVRKVENYIFGGSTENIMIETASKWKEKEAQTKALEEAKKRAKDFSNKYAKTTVSDDIINKAVELYMNNFFNEADWLKWQDEYKAVFNEKKATEKFPAEGQQLSGTKSEATIKEVEDIILEATGTSVAKKVVDVISSTTELKDGGYGILKLQSERLDRGNPQFGKFWGTWNDNILGNQEFYKNLATEGVKTLEAFQTKLKDQFSKKFKEAVDALDSSKALDYIK